MANKTYRYEILWCWKEDGNREIVPEVFKTTATTVPRAISKLVKDLNDEDGAGDGAQEIKASDLMVVDVRCPQLTARHTALSSPTAAS